MNIRPASIAGAAATSLLVLAGSAQAAISITDTVTAASTPTSTVRLFRDGVASTCATMKTYPGTTLSGTFGHNVATVYNPSSSSQCVTITITLNSNVTSVPHSMLYLGSFDASNLATNYLGDAGSSPSPAGASQSYSVMVPAFATLALVTELTGAGSANYTITSAELSATPPATPTLGEWAMIALSTLLGGMGLAMAMRRRKALAV